MSDIDQVIEQLEKQKVAIDQALAALRGISGTTIGVPVKRRRGRPAKKGAGGKRFISAEGRARIAEAARRRWAEIRKTGGNTLGSARKAAVKKRARKQSSKQASTTE